VRIDQSLAAVTYSMADYSRHHTPRKRKEQWLCDQLVSSQTCICTQQKQKAPTTQFYQTPERQWRAPDADLPRSDCLKSGACCAFSWSALRGGIVRLGRIAWLLLHAKSLSRVTRHCTCGNGAGNTSVIAIDRILTTSRAVTIVMWQVPVRG
jgi:hypothetical protein